MRRDVAALVAPGFLDAVAEGAMPMKAIVIVEYADSAGERWLYWEADENQRIWETQGLLASVTSDVNAISATKGEET